MLIILLILVWIASRIYLIVDNVTEGKAFDCFKAPSVCSAEFRPEDWSGLSE